MATDGRCRRKTYTWVLGYCRLTLEFECAGVFSFTLTGRPDLTTGGDKERAAAALAKASGLTHDEAYRELWAPLDRDERSPDCKGQKPFIERGEGS